MKNHHIFPPIPQAQAAGPSPYLRAYGDEDQDEGAVLAQWKKMQCLGAVVTNGGCQDWGYFDTLW